MTHTKTRVLVLFGGRSPEHDVSIITGLQAIAALDPARYDAIPLYVAPNGAWLTGAALLQRANYIPGPALQESLTPVTLDLTPRQSPALVTLPRSFWQKSARIEFDVALPAFHGLIGEDGGIQGLFETANVPYAGMRLLASSVLMDKAATKRMLAGTAVPVLPFWEIKRPAQGLLLTPQELADSMPQHIAFPCCIKPAHLGSSIGVAQVRNMQEVSDILATSIFRYDDTALLEPFVDNLVEYNVAVRRGANGIVTSAIERPKRSSELLDFKTKYMSGGTKGAPKNGGAKSGAQASEGMLSLTRDINPDIPPAFEAKIRAWATEVYACVSGSGAPRLDFLCNGSTGEIWFNEANPTPGSFAYFLWEAAKQDSLLFSELLGNLIAEAQTLHTRAQIPTDPTPEDARLFARR
jgi:D-alanine-D-alanine ligase